VADSTGDADADAVIASYAGSPVVTGDADADAVIHGFGKADKQETAKKGSSVYDTSRPAIGDSLVDQLHQMASGAYHSAIGGYKGLGTLALTRDPGAAAAAVDAETGKAYQAPQSGLGTALASNYNPANWIPRLSQSGAQFASEHGASPALSTAIETIPQGMAMLGGIRALPRLGASGVSEAAETTQEALNRAYAGKSMGAASTAPDISGASPALQKGIADAARKTGGAVNLEVLNRRLEADSLPVKMQLTEGQATQDPSILSNEQNLRGRHQELADMFNDQNRGLADNFRAIREAAGPDVFSTNPVEHGDTLIQAYNDKGAAADADISQKYRALRDANGGKFPVDAPTLLRNASDQLHQQLLYDHAPKAVMSTLGRLSDANNMTFENFESLRTNLARIQRSSIDGNEAAAAGVIRNAMENLPLSEGAAALKPLADTARSAAKAQYDAVNADPAYKAAIEDKVPPDRFVQKFIIGAPRDDVATMKANLADNDRASQTMGVAAIDHLRKQSGLDDLGNGNVSQAALNKNLQALHPKMGSLLPPEQAQQLDTLGNVARYTQAQPRGSFVNNSNTLVGSLAGHGAGALEGMANVAAKGIPVGTLIRRGLENRAAGNTVKRALNPSSGLDRLTETNNAP
jgi:hypothetical protein